MKKIEKCLIARGVDSSTAKILSQYTKTLNDAFSLGSDDLSSIVNDDVSQKLVKLSKRRRPIPDKILYNTLIKNKFTCCVCRDPKKSIVIHHINPYSESKDNSEENLCVLCLDDHGKAHSHHQLSKNLDRESLLEFKNHWENLCSIHDAKVLKDAQVAKSINFWAYFNHQKIHEMAKKFDLTLNMMSGYRECRANNLIEKNGELIAIEPNYRYMYDKYEHKYLVNYHESILENIFTIKRIINISDNLDRIELTNTLQEGDMIFVKGRHTFKNIRKIRSGKGITMIGKRSANKIKIIFTFDRWEATSNSAFSLYLIGTSSMASVILINDISKENEKTFIRGTVLAIGYGFNSLKTRDYDSPKPDRTSETVSYEVSDTLF